MNTFPPIEELLPHRGTMLLLDRVVDFSSEALVAEYSPQPKAWYADDTGSMPGWIGIELMAQAIAAHVALNKRQVGRPLKMGALLGTRSYTMSSPGSFPAGQCLRVHVHESFRDESGLAAYDCRIDSKSQALASATLKVYEPDDFGAFMQESTQ